VDKDFAVAKLPKDNNQARAEKELRTRVPEVMKHQIGHPDHRVWEAIETKKVREERQGRLSRLLYARSEVRKNPATQRAWNGLNQLPKPHPENAAFQVTFDTRYTKASPFPLSDARITPDRSYASVERGLAANDMHINAMGIDRVSVRDVPIRDLRAIQPGIEAKKVRAMVSEGLRPGTLRPYLIDAGHLGMLIQDGHHRSSYHALSGDTMVEKANVRTPVKLAPAQGEAIRLLDKIVERQLLRPDKRINSATISVKKRLVDEYRTAITGHDNGGKVTNRHLLRLADQRLKATPTHANLPTRVARAETMLPKFGAAFEAHLPGVEAKLAARLKGPSNQTILLSPTKAAQQMHAASAARLVVMSFDARVRADRLRYGPDSANPSGHLTQRGQDLYRSAERMDRLNARIAPGQDTTPHDRMLKLAKARQMQLIAQGAKSGVRVGGAAGAVVMLAGLAHSWMNNGTMHTRSAEAMSELEANRRRAG
jgi:hypothetical protein